MTRTDSTDDTASTDTIDDDRTDSADTASTDSAGAETPSVDETPAPGSVDDTGRTSSGESITDDSAAGLFGDSWLDPSRWSDATDDEGAIRAVGRLVFGGLAVMVVLFLISLLPGIDVAGPTFAAVASAVLTISFVAVLGYLSLVLPPFVRTLVERPPALREHGATATFWTVLLAAILVAHRGLDPLIELLGGEMWFYDVLFLLAALGPLVLIARSLWAMIDPAATYVSGRVTDES